MKRTLTGILIATVALFAWGAAFWMNPLAMRAFEHVVDNDAAGQALLDHFPATGTYYVPSEMENQEAWSALHERGPLAMVHIRTAGAPVMAPGMFVRGFLHELVVVALIALLLRMAAPALRTYGARVGFVLLAGAAAALFNHLSFLIWWYHPAPFHWVTGLYDVTGWLVAGLVLAAFVRPPEGR